MRYLQQMQALNDQLEPANHSRDATERRLNNLTHKLQTLQVTDLFPVRLDRDAQCAANIASASTEEP